MGSSKPAPGHRRSNVYVGVAFAAAAAAAAALLVLAFAVFRPKQPTTTVNSIEVDGLNVGFDLANLGVELNATIILDISVTNPNGVGFDHGEGSADLYYRGRVVGEATIPPGNIGAGETIETVVRLVILADRIVTGRKVYSDLMDGRLVVAAATRIPGKFTVMGIFKHRAVMYSTCDVTINVGNKEVTHSNCKSRTQF